MYHNLRLSLTRREIHNEGAGVDVGFDSRGPLWCCGQWGHIYIFNLIFNIGQHLHLCRPLAIRTLIRFVLLQANGRHQASKIQSPRPPPEYVAGWCVYLLSYAKVEVCPSSSSGPVLKVSASFTATE